jgi:hypothetical protein
LVVNAAHRGRASWIQQFVSQMFEKKVHAFQPWWLLLEMNQPA